MDKKGAINLSINMIIVLIIAIIILGFALSFITGMFRKAEVSLTGQFPEPQVTVNKDNPIGIGSDFLLEGGETRRMTLKVLNTADTALSVGDTSDITFSCQSGATNVPVVEATETISNLASGAVGSMKVVFRGTSGMQNNDICTITVGDSSGGQVSQSFFMSTE